MPRVLAVACTFIAVVFGWVLFRANTIGEAWHIYVAMLGLNGIGLSWVQGKLVSLALLGVALVVAFSVDTYDLRPPTRVRWAVIYGLLLMVCITMLSRPSPFLYFQF